MKYLLLLLVIVVGCGEERNDEKLHKSIINFARASWEKGFAQGRNVELRHTLDNSLNRDSIYIVDSTENELFFWFVM